VTRVVWSRAAAEQLGLIRRPDLRRRVFRAITGLAVYPQRGRIPPEVVRYTDLHFSGALREIIFPRLVRVFYRHEADTEKIFVLGMAFRGQEVGEDWLRHHLEE
jgi:plasmid stabilization system protein ParE